MAELLEIMMIVCFGFSWPMNVIKSYRARTTTGKSLPFLLLIFIGYIFGITAKLIAPSFKWYVLFFYILNLFFILINIYLTGFIMNVLFQTTNQFCNHITLAHIFHIARF